MNLARRSSRLALCFVVIALFTPRFTLAAPASSPLAPAPSPSAAPAKASTVSLPTKPATKPASSGPVKPTSDDAKAAARVITDLYDAYAARDLDRVMALERVSIDESAQTYEKQGKGKADDVREAFRGATEELLTHKDFRMQPLNLKDAQFQRVGDTLVVTSPIPIVATASVEVGTPGEGRKVRLRIGKFILKKGDAGFQIVRMQFF